MNRSLEEAVGSVRETAESFSRSIECKVYGMEEGALAVARFTDRFHDLTLEILVDRKTFCILEAEAHMDKTPYDICRSAPAGIKALRGLSIYHRAVNREVRRRIPRKKGCTHLFELVEFTLGALFSGLPQAGMHGDRSPRPIEDLDPEEHRRRHMDNPWLQNTCCAFVVEKRTGD